MKLSVRAIAALAIPALLVAGAPSGAAETPAAIAPAPGKALVVFHTRVAAARAIPEGRLHFRPYDRATGRLGVNGFDTQGHHFTAGRWIGLVSNKSHREWKGWAVEVEPGSYVLASAENPNLVGMDSIFPYSWAFEVAPDTVTYAGDFTLSWTKLAKGWGLNVIPEFDEPRAKALAGAKARAGAPFAAAPVRPVELSRNADKSWTVRDAQ